MFLFITYIAQGSVVFIHRPGIGTAIMASHDYQLTEEKWIPPFAECPFGYQGVEEKIISLLTKCSFCLNDLRDPEVLPCCHVVCYKCVLDNFDYNFRCPVCREEAPLWETPSLWEADFGTPSAQHAGPTLAQYQVPSLWEADFGTPSVQHAGPTLAQHQTPSLWEADSRKRKRTSATCEDMVDRWPKRRRTRQARAVVSHRGDYGGSDSHFYTKRGVVSESWFDDHDSATVSKHGKKHKVFSARKKYKVVNARARRKHKRGSKKTMKDRMLDNMRPTEVTVSDSIQTDVKQLDNIHLPELMWYEREIKTEVVDPVVYKPEQVKFTGTQEQPDVIVKQKKVKLHEVCRICLKDQRYSVSSMVVHKQHIYVTSNDTGLTIQCYTTDGQLRHNYCDDTRKDTNVQGLCSIEKGSEAMLVVSDHSGQTLIWIRIRDDFTLRSHRTQNLCYKPSGLYNDEGHLMVCDQYNHNIHHYDCIGRPLHVIALPDDVMPRCVKRHNDHYVVTAWQGHVVIIDRQGNVVKSHIDNLQRQGDLTIDKSGRILVCDMVSNQVKVLNKYDADFKVFAPLQHVKSPTCLGSDENKLFLLGSDTTGATHLIIYDYDYFY